MKIGLITGHKIPGLLKDTEEITVETSYGDVSMEVSTIEEHEIFFIPRHGHMASLPPHNVKYRANIQAFASSHVDCILSMGTVGSMKRTIHPGDFVIPDDFIDFTKTRPQTFYDNQRVHVDMTAPFCPSLREIVIQSCKKIPQVTLHQKGIYLTTEGPRLESAAEIRFLSPYADIVGMTIGPEVILAREKGICYASLCLVCNMAAGLQERLTADDISQIIKQKEPTLRRILLTILQAIDKKKDCACQSNLSQATL